MSLQYCTFWYPTIYHQDLLCLYQHGKVFSGFISDKGKAKYHISILLDDKENLHITSSISNKVKFDVVLTKTNIRRNGFVQYSFDLSDVPTGYEADFKKVLCKDAYHISKQFYHNHETNHGEEGRDSALRAIITNTPEPVDTYDNRFLIGFLTDYTTVFQVYAREISSLNVKVQSREDMVSRLEKFIRNNPSHGDIKSIKTAIQNHNKAITTLCLDINKMCENALIEYTYCKTLWSSKYNLSFHHNTIPHGTVRNNLRRQALNIRNSIRYIENIKYKNQNRFNLLSIMLLDELNSTTERIDEVLSQNRQTGKTNSIITWFSVFLAIIFGIKSVIDSDSSTHIVWFITLVAGAIVFAYLIAKSRQRKI